MTNTRGIDSVDLHSNLDFVQLMVSRKMVEHVLDLNCQMHWLEVI